MLPYWKYLCEWGYLETYLEYYTLRGGGSNMLEQTTGNIYISSLLYIYIYIDVSTRKFILAKQVQIRCCFQGWYLFKGIAVFLDIPYWTLNIFLANGLNSMRFLITNCNMDIKTGGCSLKSTPTMLGLRRFFSVVVWGSPAWNKVVYRAAER